MTVTACASRRESTSPGSTRAAPTSQPAAAAPEGPGRIVIRSSTVALGYWNRPDAQAEHFRDGAFAPSDLFERTDKRLLALRRT